MTALDYIQLLGSLLLVTAILVATYYGTRWYARRVQGTGGAGRHIKILDRAPLDQRSFLAVVQVGEKYYLLGVSEKNVQSLGELPDMKAFYAEDSEQVAPVPKAFRDMLDKAKERIGYPNKKDDDSGAK